MTDIVCFTIPGRVRGKGRPRAFLKKNGRIGTYTDDKTSSCESVVRDCAAKAMGDNPPIEGPVAISILSYSAIPKSWSKKRKAEAYHATGKPDADNVLKLIGDACNGILWRDDSQITDIKMKRRYTHDQERVEIVVTDLSRPIAIARTFAEARAA